MTREEELNARRERSMAEEAARIRAWERTDFAESVAHAVDFISGQIDLVAAHVHHQQQLALAQREEME